MNITNNNYKLLSELNINVSNINLTHDLDEFEGIRYKFGEAKHYPDLFNQEQKSHNYMDHGWKEDIRHVIDNLLQDGVTYSMGVLGTHYKDGNLDSITFGEHLLVTNKIDIEGLMIYLEGKIDSTHLSMESGRIVEKAGEDFKIQFKYREISISREVFDSASQIKHSEKLETNETKETKETTSQDLKYLAKVHYNKNILKFLNIIPLTNNFTDFGEIINVNHSTRDGKFGVLYQYNSNIEIFIYDHKGNKYSGIIYKKGYEYSKFTDVVLLNNPDYDLIRTFGNNSIFIKDGSIVHMDTVIKSKQIKTQNRQLIHNTKHLTFDIECYLEENKEYKERKKENNINNQDER
jgi:hypothetical protein